MKMIQEAKSKPINLDDDIKSKVLALINKTLERYALRKRNGPNTGIINSAFHLDILKVVVFFYFLGWCSGCLKLWVEKYRKAKSRCFEF
ncbi:hypothetical protein ACS0TY_013162 [Phlomoides rotata]